MNDYQARQVSICNWIAELSGLPFQWEHTGGGCSSATANMAGYYFMVTDEGAGVPDENSEGVTVGVYLGDDNCDAEHYEFADSIPKACAWLKDRSNWERFIK